MRFFVMTAILGMPLLLPLSSPKAVTDPEKLVNVWRTVDLEDSHISGGLDPETSRFQAGLDLIAAPKALPTGMMGPDEAVTAKLVAASVGDLFVNGPPEGSLDDATLRRLNSWLPAAIQNSDANYRRDRQKSEDVITLAKSMGYKGRQVWERDGRDGERRVTQFSAIGAASFLKGVRERDAVLKTAAALPSAFDIFDFAMTNQIKEKLSGLDNEERRDSFLQNLRGGADRVKRKAAFEKSDFQMLNAWLPDILVGLGDIPDDAESQTLLVRFAERLGWSNEPEKPGNANRRSIQRETFERARQKARDLPISDKAAEALNYLKQEQFLQRSLIAEEEKASTIFEEGPGRGA